MSKLVYAKEFLEDYADLDSDVRRRVQELPEKIAAGSVKGTRLKKLVNAADPRVRTIRVTQFWRGVVLLLDGGLYVLIRVMAHDDANRWAATQKFEVNPVTGIFEMFNVAEISATADALRTAEPVIEEPSPDPELVFAGCDDKDFVKLGVSEDLVPVLRTLTTETQVLGLAGQLPDAQAAAVLGLADGRSPQDIWAELVADYDLETGARLTVDANESSLAEETDEPAAPKIDTADVEAALDRPGSRSRFLAVEDDDIARALEGDFEAWRTFLHPTQHKVAYKDTFNGPAKVTGGAGTGKTVVAIHRARHLAQRLLAEGRDEQVLFATYTTALRDDLQRTLKGFCSPDEYRRIHVTNVDAYASQVAREDGGVGQYVGPGQLDELADNVAIESGLLADAGYNGRWLVTEWEQVVLARQLDSLRDYLLSPRPGRGVPLQRRDRRRVWEAIELLRDRLDETGRFTVLQAAARGADALDQRDVRPFAHVVVDEAQDLHPSQWRLLRACVRGPDEERPNDLFIAGDAHQRIYDNRVSLSSMGIETRGRSTRLKVNYRTSQRILDFALAIIRGESFDDLDEGSDDHGGYRSAYTGSSPVRKSFTTAGDEARWVANQVMDWLTGGLDVTVGILGRTRRHLEAAQRSLEAAGITAGSPADAEQVTVSTMHSAKGMEFTHLVVVAVNADAMPLPASLTDASVDPKQHELDLLRERCLLYVACTRARDSLVVTNSSSASFLLPGTA